jgi:hypothetical protein
MPKRIYRLGFYLYILGILLMVGGLIFHNLQSVLLSAKMLVFSAAGLMIVAFVKELLKFIIAHWQNKLLQGLLALLGSAGATVSLVSARLLVNYFTKVDPSHFPIAISLFTIFFTLVTWLAMAVMILFSIYLVPIFVSPILISPGLLIVPIYCEIRNSYFHRFIFRNQASDLSEWLKRIEKTWENWLGRAARRTFGCIYISVCRNSF